MMKVCKFLTLAVAAIALAACGKQSMTPVATKINGPLSDYFEVVSREYVPKNGKVSIEFRRIAEGFPEPWQPSMEVGYDDGEFEPLFTIEFRDADGNVLSKEQTSIVWDLDELKEIAALSVDETASISFDCDEPDAAQFKVGSTFEVNGEIEQTVDLAGGIGPYAIKMTLHIAPNREVTGAYYYQRQGPGNYLYVKGEKSDDQIGLREFTKDGTETGAFDGKFSASGYKGRFTANSRTYEFDLRPTTEMETIDLSLIDFDAFYVGDVMTDDDDEDDDDSYGDFGSELNNAIDAFNNELNNAIDEIGNEFNDALNSAFGLGGNNSNNNNNNNNNRSSSSASSSSSADWDAVLDSYERNVDRYVAVMQKVAKGDLTALAESASLLSEAQELSDKLSKAKGSMSDAQTSRYMKILKKMTDAAQSMMK